MNILITNKNALILNKIVDISKSSAGGMDQQGQSQRSQESGCNRTGSPNRDTRRPYVGSGRLSPQHLDNMAREQERYDQPQNNSSTSPGQRQASPQDNTTAPQQYSLTGNQFYQFQPRYNISAPPAQRPAAANIDCTPAIREQTNQTFNSPPSQDPSEDVGPITDAFAFFAPSSEPPSTQTQEEWMSSKKIEESGRRPHSPPPAQQPSTSSGTSPVSPLRLQELARQKLGSSPPKTCKSPTRSPERQPASAEAFPSVADAKKYFYQQSVNLQPTDAAGVNKSSGQPQTKG